MGALSMAKDYVMRSAQQQTDARLRASGLDKAGWNPESFSAVFFVVDILLI